MISKSPKFLKIESCSAPTLFRPNWRPWWFFSFIPYLTLWNCFKFNIWITKWWWSSHLPNLHIYSNSKFERRIISLIVWYLLTNLINHLILWRVGSCCSIIIPSLKLYLVDTKPLTNTKYTDTLVGWSHFSKFVCYLPTTTTNKWLPTA